MSIKIHHGPPGSYKTAGAVTDDLIPALKAGRSVVTNIRGIDIDALHEHFQLPDSFELIHVDTTTREGRDRLGRWFQWAPYGALIFIDEAQSIFPKRWRDADLRKFDIPMEDAKELNKPATWEDAWDMHRHFNWDVILTTPDITKIRDDIRDASEMAYKHKNLGLYGLLFKGSYIEGVHSKDNNGSNTGNFHNVRSKRIKKNALTWKLYQSTATGDITETKAGFNIFSNPRLLISGAFLLGAILYFATADVTVLGNHISLRSAMADDKKPDKVAVSKAHPETNHYDRSDVPRSAPAALPNLTFSQRNKPQSLADVDQSIDWSQIGACVVFKGECKCYGDSAERLDIPELACKKAVFNGWAGRTQQAIVTKSTISPGV